MRRLQFIPESNLAPWGVDYRSTPAAGTFYRALFSFSLEKHPNCFSPGAGVSLEQAHAVQ
jgi:hypothetical protein